MSNALIFKFSRFPLMSLVMHCMRHWRVSGLSWMMEEPTFCMSLVKSLIETSDILTFLSMQNWAETR